MNKKTIIVIIAVVVVSIIGGIYLNMSDHSEEVVEESNPQIETVDTIETEDFDKYLFALGKVSPKEIKVYTNLSNEIDEVLVSKGDVVSKGDILYTLKDSSYNEKKIKSNQLQIELIYRDWDTYFTDLENLKRDLAEADPDDEKYIYYLEVEIMKAEKVIVDSRIQIQALEDEIETLEDNPLNVVADFDGYVTAVDEDSQSVVTVYSRERVVNISVAEGDVELIEVGDQAEIEVRANSEFSTTTGTISEISIVPDSLVGLNTSNYPVTVTIDEEIPFGYRVTVKFEK